MNYRRIVDNLLKQLEARSVTVERAAANCRLIESILETMKDAGIESGAERERYEKVKQKDGF